jgi:hypothetical protein
MLLYFNVILTLVLGLIIGLNLKSRSFLNSRVPGFRSPTTPYNTHFLVDENLNTQVQNQSQEMNNCFDILEVRFLTKILTEPLNKVDVTTLNALANLTLLSAENQRQRRHLFLKELNLKLFLLYGLRESIIRVDDINDKRIKNYTLSEKIDLDKLKSNLGLLD